MITTVRGDLIKLAKEGKFSVIVHGCNCFRKMDGGLAKQIGLAFPEAYDADLQTEYGVIDKLGSYSCHNYVVYDFGGDPCDLWVINAYTQFEPEPHFEYAALRSCLQKIKRDFPVARIGMPKIGSGIGGGHWPTIEHLIQKELWSKIVTIVEYEE